MTKLRKNPWISVVLNLFFWGIGYVYNGKRIGFGISLFFADMIVNASFFYQIFALSSLEFISQYAILILSVAFAYDGYKEAQQINTGKL